MAVEQPDVLRGQGAAKQVHAPSTPWCSAHRPTGPKWPIVATQRHPSRRRRRAAAPAACPTCAARRHKNTEISPTCRSECK